MAVNSMSRAHLGSPSERRRPAGPRRSSWQGARRAMACADRRRKGLNRGAIRAYWLSVGVAEALMAIRLISKLVTAEPGTAVTQLVYPVTDILLAPFHGLSPEPQPIGRVLELPTIIAILLYFVFAWTAMDSLLLVLDRPPVVRIARFRRRPRAAGSHRLQEDRR
jgi:hypothetical protein